MGGKGTAKAASNKGGNSEYAKGASKGTRKGDAWAGSKSGSKGKSGSGGVKPTDSSDFVVLSEGNYLEGSKLGVRYIVESYVASGTFSRVFKVRQVPALGVSGSDGSGQKRRWAKEAPDSPVYAAKVMRHHDSYIQYTSDARKEGDMLKRLEQAQVEAGMEVLTMRCLDSFETQDANGVKYWCLILEWLDASIFDLVNTNRGRGLHVSMIRILLSQLLEQLRVLQQLEITHTDIKHKNCCLADGEYFMQAGPNDMQSLILTNPSAKFIDFGNAVFEGDEKVHPIHTKQFRAPEVLLNISDGWGPPSDTWTVGITAAFMVCGQLVFNSHDPCTLVRTQVEALGAFPDRLLQQARDARVRRAAQEAAREDGGTPQLGTWLGLAKAAPGSAEAQCADLILRMLAPDPEQRISPQEALAHPFFATGEPAIPSRPDGAELRNVGAAGQAKGRSTAGFEKGGKSRGK